MKQIQLENKRIVNIEKLPLKRYSDLLKAFQKLPKHINSFEKLSNEEILLKLPSILADSLPDVIAIFTIATDLTAEEVENLGLDEATDIFLGVIEVNNYKSVYEKVKKALGSQTATVPMTTGTGGQ